MTGNWIRRPEGGGRLSLRLLRSFALSFGRAPARGILYFIAFYFMLRRGAERRASRAFLGRAIGRPATHLEIYRHILHFSQVTLDRIFLLQEGMQRFEIECVGLDDIHGMMALNRGVLLFGAHFGSFEILRVLSLRRPDLKFRAVIDLEQAPAMSQLLNALNPELAATVINAREAGPAVVLAIKDALEQRAAVTLLADRVRPWGPRDQGGIHGHTRVFSCRAVGDRRAARRAGRGVFWRLPRRQSISSAIRDPDGACRAGTGGRTPTIQVGPGLRGSTGGAGKGYAVQLVQLL